MEEGKYMMETYPRFWVPVDVYKEGRKYWARSNGGTTVNANTVKLIKLTEAQASQLDRI